MGVAISVTNQKGGVGKTTIVSSLAYILNQKGYKVLSLPLDPQRNFEMVAGKGVAIKANDTTTPSMLSVLEGKHTIEEAIIHNTLVGDVVPASSLLSGWNGLTIMSEEEFYAIQDPVELRRIMDERFRYRRQHPDNYIIRELIQPIKEKYDYIFFDTNPSLMLLTTNALCATDYMLVPIKADHFSRDAISQLWDTIRSLNYFDNTHTATIAGLVMNCCKTHTRSMKAYEKLYAKRAGKLGTILFDTKIRDANLASVSTSELKPLAAYPSKSNPIVDDLHQFADEFIVRIQQLEEEKCNGERIHTN